MCMRTSVQACVCMPPACASVPNFVPSVAVREMNVRSCVRVWLRVWLRRGVAWRGRNNEQAAEPEKESESASTYEKMAG